MPENLSSVLASSPRVDGMYDAGAPFSLDVLIGEIPSRRPSSSLPFASLSLQISLPSIPTHTEAVNAERPDLTRSQHFYWTEIGAADKSSADRSSGGKKKAAAADGESEGAAGTLTRARRIEATSAPPLRPWEKDRYSGATVGGAGLVATTRSALIGRLT